MQCEASPQTPTLVLALPWRAGLQRDRMWKSPERNEEIPRLPAGPRFPLLICSEPLRFLWSPTVLLLCPSALSYTFVREKPQVVMEVQLQSTMSLTCRRALYTKELKRYLAHLSLPSPPWRSHLLVFGWVVPGCTDTASSQKTFQLNRISFFKY